jgi:hypothetical protein
MCVAYSVNCGLEIPQGDSEIADPTLLVIDVWCASMDALDDIFNAGLNIEPARLS